MTRRQYAALSESDTVMRNIPDATPQQWAQVEATLAESGDYDVMDYLGMRGYRYGEPGFGGAA